MLALLFSCHGKWILQIICPISNPLVVFIFNRQLLVSRRMIPLFSLIRMLMSLVCHHEDPNCSSCQFNKTMPTLFLLPTYSFGYRLLYRRRSCISVRWLLSLTLGSFCKLKNRTLLLENLFTKNI